MNQAKLQALVEKQAGKGNIHNIVLGVQSTDRSIDLAAAAGNADSGRPMTPETPYYIASITKMVTAAVILKLVEQGKINLDTLISAYLPADLIAGIHVLNGQDCTGQIKVYHLLSMTSGLADYFEDKPAGGQSILDKLMQGQDIALDLPEVMALVRDLKPHFAPGADNGKKAHYSDTNFQVLRASAEAVTGKPLEQLFGEMIFSPLNLTQTYASSAPPATLSRPPAIAYINDQPAHAPKFLASQVPDGGMVSTVTEQLTFLRAFFDGQLFDAGLFGRMKQWNGIFFPLQYGYGMMRFKLPRVFSPFKPIPELIGHSGSTGSFAYYSPEKGLYLAGTINQMGAPRLPFQLMPQVMNLVG